MQSLVSLKKILIPMDVEFLWKTSVSPLHIRRFVSVTSYKWILLTLWLFFFSLKKLVFLFLDRRDRCSCSSLSLSLFHFSSVNINIWCAVLFSKSKEVLCLVDDDDTLQEKTECSWLNLMLHRQLRTTGHFRKSLYRYHITTYIFAYTL